MAVPPDGELNLATLRPKGALGLRLMFDGGWKVLTLLGLVFAIIGLVMVFVAYYTISLEQRYKREGQTVAGTVTAKDTYTTTHTSGTGRRRRRTTRRHYRVDYTFKDGQDKSHSGQGEIGSGKWHRLKTGDAIDIEYLPAEPSKNRPKGSGALAWLIVIFPVAFGGGGLAMLYFARRHARRHASLLREGTLTRGVVEEKTPNMSMKINNRHPMDVTFTFALPDGEIHTGKEMVTNLKFAAKLQPGQPVGVIYMANEPDSCTIFRDKWTRFFRSSVS